MKRSGTTVNNKRRERKLKKFAQAIAELEKSCKGLSSLEAENLFNDKMDELLQDPNFTVEDLIWIDNFIQKNKLI